MLVDGKTVVTQGGYKETYSGLPSHYYQQCEQDQQEKPDNKEGMLGALHLTILTKNRLIILD